jgi:hypothetical protein
MYPVSTGRGPVFLGGLLRLRLSGRRPIVFPFSIPRLEAFAQLLYDLMLARMLPASLDRLRQGERVRFGPLEADLTGLWARGSFLPWDRVVPATLTEDDVVLRRLGRDEPWFSAALEDVPNVHVFLALVRSLLADRAGR